MEKFCSKCQQVKSINNFKFRKDKGYYECWCNECFKEYKKQHKKKYYLKHKEKIDEYNKNYNKQNYLKNKENAIKRVRIWNNEHKEYRQQYMKKYNKEYKKQKMENDELYRFKTIARIMILNSFKRKNLIKKCKAEKIVGCNFEFLKKHLEDTFLKNYGYEYNNNIKVHIDHIIPLSTAKTEDDVIKLCHYTNLQLLKASDNLKKGSKINNKLKEEMIC